MVTWRTCLQFAFAVDAVAETLCTPQVAFSRSGDFFVADGYCNSRVLRFSPDGAFIQEYTLPVRRGIGSSQTSHTGLPAQR